MARHERKTRRGRRTRRGGLVTTARRAPINARRRRRSISGRTRRGRKDFSTKKSSKVFNRRSRYQRRSSRGALRRPFSKRRAGAAGGGVVERAMSWVPGSAANKKYYDEKTQREDYLRRDKVNRDAAHWGTSRVDTTVPGWENYY